ncbi:MAG: hypothetical protein JW904_14800 [Spirochaetales bacterium]|nr:hypothetical protein [Spirochaetales bacterium]
MELIAGASRLTAVSPARSNYNGIKVTRLGGFLSFSRGKNITAKFDNIIKI